MNGEKLNLTLESVSSEYSEQRSAICAFDGDVTSYWRPTSVTDQYLIVKVDSSVHLTGFRIYPDDHSYRVNSFTLSISTDGVNFDDVYTGECSFTKSWMEYEFESALVGSYIKITFNGYSSARLYVYDFELYGEPASVEPDEPEVPEDPESKISYGIESFNTSPIGDYDGSWTFGIRFKVAEKRKLIGFRLFAVEMRYQVALKLWDSNQNSIASSSVTGRYGEWTEVYLDNPVILSSNTEYRLSYSFNGRYNWWDINSVVTSDGFTLLGGCEGRGDTYPSTDDTVFWGLDVIFDNGTSEPDEPDVPEEPEEPKIYTHTIDFTDPEWKTQRSDVFSVTDGTTPFFVDSTLPYDGKTTLRSGAIGNSGISETTINFTLIADGSIELNYTVSSESNYDWLRISVDDTEVVTVSGTVSWTVYTKDGSSSSGSDAGAIGYVTLTGVAKDYDRKYLIQSGTSLFTVTDGVLTAVTGSVNAELFRTHGADEVPSSELLITLADPVVLYWVDTFEHPIKPLVAIEHAVPFPQVVKSPDYSMRHPSIKGIEKAIVTASDDVGFAVSFDSGDTWLVWTGSAWGTLSEGDTGMSAETMNSISSEDWNSIATTGTFKFRAVLPTINSTITSLVIDYLN